LGTSLNDSEFKLLIRSLDPRQEGRVDVDRLQSTLAKEVADFDYKKKQQIIMQRLSNPRYTKSFESKVDLFSSVSNPTNFDDNGCESKNIHPHEYKHPRQSSKQLRKESMDWTKIRTTLQNNPESVLAAFTPHQTCTQSLPRGYAKEELNFVDIKKKLSKAGVQLGEADTKTLEHHLKESFNQPKYHLISSQYDEEACSSATAAVAAVDNNSQNEKATKVSVHRFCDVVGIPIKTRHDDRIG
jgi:hypothetical protein